MADNGIGKGAVNGFSTAIIITVFISIAFYNVLELNFIIFATFKRRSGLYFWSFLVSTWGIALYAVGFLIKDLALFSNHIFYVTFIIVGWCSMVSGQSIVLYSRLHLVLRERNHLKFVLGMIIFNAIIGHTPIIVLIYGSESNNPTPYIMPYSIYEKVQVTIFFLQECTISGLYIFYTVKILRPEGNIRGDCSRKIMRHLIYINAIIVILDITILGLEYSGLYDVQTAYKALAYSVKLKLEFRILNQLVELTQRGRRMSSSYLSDRGIYINAAEGKRSTITRRDSGMSQNYQAYVTSAQAGNGRQQNRWDRSVNNGIVVTTTTSAVSTEINGTGSALTLDIESLGERAGVESGNVPKTR